MITETTIFNGASPEALAAIESVQPPHLIRKVWQATAGRRSSYMYKIEVFRIGGSISGPMDGEMVAGVVFNADGSPVDGEQSWVMNYNAERAICDLFAALCKNGRTASCAHEKTAWTVGGPGDGEGWVMCVACGVALHPDDPLPSPYEANGCSWSIWTRTTP